MRANAVRHGCAREIVIALNQCCDVLELRVEDNGVGMATDKMPAVKGMGLRTMRYRAQSVGATFEITPRSAGGTCVCCRLKLPA